MSAGESAAPHSPRFVSEDLEPAGGRIGPEPEDFVVDEVLSFAPSGQGEQLWVRMRKRLFTSVDMIRTVARAAGVPERDVGSAGMKDKHAVTTQWISLPGGARPPPEWRLPEGIVALESARASRKLRTGQQRGNRFAIRLVDLPPGGFERARAICARLSEIGLANYFGAQRFGRDGDNLEQARRWLFEGGPPRGKKTRFYRKFYPSVIQAEVFNRYVTARMFELRLDRLLDGEVVRLDGSSSVFVVADPARELERLRARDIHPTGPIFGPKMKSAEREALLLERRAIESLELDADAALLLGRLADGTRRDVRVFPDGLGMREVGEAALLMEFFLPSGSYATELVRELTRALPGEERRGAG